MFPASYRVRTREDTDHTLLDDTAHFEQMQQGNATKGLLSVTRFHPILTIAITALKILQREILWTARLVEQYVPEDTFKKAVSVTSSVLQKGD